MSIEKTPRGEYRVRWREGGRNRSKLIGPRRKDAEAFEQEVKRAKRMGTLAHLEMGEKTLEAFGPLWWKRHARRKAEKTQANYAWAWDSYVLPRFGAYRLCEISVGEVEEWLSDLSDDGTGIEAQRKALKLLKQILNAAVKWDELATNPVSLVDTPRYRPEPVDPPTPLEVERVRAALMARGRIGEAVLVSVMAYAGLRPHEVWPLTWPDVMDRTILVRTRQKVGATGRAVPILAPLGRDLNEWKLATGQRHSLVFPNRAGREWTVTTFNNWRRRVWRDEGIMPSGPSPYKLRHTYVSLLIREGLSVVEVAKRAGHGPEVCLRTYAHIWDELAGSGSAEEAIRAARAEVHGGERVAHG